MTPYHLMIALAAVCAVSFIAVTIVAVGKLQNQGQKINYLFIKLVFPVYVHRYNQMIREQTGKSSPLFTAWLIAINGTWIFALFALLLKQL